MRTRDIDAGGKIVKGFEIDMARAPLVLVVGQKGYAMCGYLNLEVAEKFGDACCIISGVETIEDLLAGKVSAVTSAGIKTGIKVGMKGISAIKKIA